MNDIWHVLYTAHTKIIPSLPVSYSDNLPYTGTHTHTDRAVKHSCITHLTETQGQFSLWKWMTCDIEQFIIRWSFSRQNEREERVGRKHTRLKALTDSMCASFSTSPQLSQRSSQIYIAIIKAKADSYFNDNGYLSNTTTVKDPKRHKSCLFVNVFMLRDWL